MPKYSYKLAYFNEKDEYELAKSLGYDNPTNLRALRHSVHIYDIADPYSNSAATGITLGGI